ARGAAVVAFATVEVLDRALQQPVADAEEPLREADAPGERVVEVDRRRAGVRRPHFRGRPKIVRIAHQEDWCDAVQELTKAGDADLDVISRELSGLARRQVGPE